MARQFLSVLSGIGLKPGSAPADPANGDLYYDTTANALMVYANGAWVQLGSGGPAVRANSVAITNATSSVVVTYSSTIGSTNYAVTCTMRNIVDTSPEFQPITITAKSATGFTATWNAPVDTANYFLEYTVIANT